MSVLIKGMDMPKSCRECPCSSWEGSAEKPRSFCHATKDHNETTNGREACPLVEVPTPHGRLIDADAHVANIKEWYCGKCNDNYQGVRCRACEAGDFMDYIEDAPTVIEGE